MSQSPPSSASFSGFIRIHMNLTRPITILLSRQPPSLTHNDDIAAADDDNDDDNDDDDDDGTVKYLSFYLPYGTSKVIHINRFTAVSQYILFTSSY